jgi:D-lactate dehydrogenase
MRVAVFSTKPYDRLFLEEANTEPKHAISYFEPRLTRETVPLVKGFDAVCVFVNDELNAAVLQELANHEIRLIALRCAGFNNVDLAAARKLGITVARVPAYSPHSVAEHAVALMLALNRKTHRAYGRVREGNFALDGLLGFDMQGRTVGVIGTGKIGVIVAKIMQGFGCQVVAHDPNPNDECKRMGVDYLEISRLLAVSDIITLHCPLTPDTRHIINADALVRMKTGIMLINTGRGALVDTRAVIRGLKSGKIGYLGLDVYEEEADLFFEDLSDQVIQDDVFSRLLTFPNVIITGHQAFFTEEAMRNISATTMANVTAFDRKEGTLHVVKGET